MKQKTAQGFTLIELLIVIAVLGILAVAVLSAINPIEQINRSKDTGNQSDAEQLLSAMDRFYAIKGNYPWLSAPCSTTACEAVGWTKIDKNWKINGDAVVDILSGSTTSTSGTGELKESFVTRIVNPIGYNSLYVYNSGASGAATYICWASQSQSFSTSAWERCGKTTSGTGLPGDLRGAAASICLGADKKNFSCLP